MSVDSGPKICECGCGQQTNVAPYNHRGIGWVKGQPMRFLRGHNARKSGTPYRIDASGCWLWTRSTTTAGYGCVYLDGKLRLAHRVFYERHIGAIPTGLHLDHLCRVPSCVNPEHLEPVTLAENTRRGSRAKLTAAAVAEIRALHDAGLTYAAIAARFGVIPGTVGKIVRGERWATGPVRNPTSART